MALALPAQGSLLGREAELARLRELTAGARAGEGGALVLRGEPGIGKTALLEAAKERFSAELRVLATAATEGESEIAYAALHGLTAPVLDRLELLPERQRVALEGALALGPAGSADRLAIGAALIGLLDAAAEEKPLLLVVDDAHWVDEASAGVLLFAARRLATERVAMLLALREGEGDRLELGGIPVLEVSGLARDPARRLLARTRDREPEPEAVESLLRATGGNPLALLELPRSVDLESPPEDQVDEPVALGERLQSAFLRRADGLPEASRAALLLAATSFSDESRPVAAAAPALETSLDALHRAERSGLVELDGGVVRFRHPLVRAAVYRGASPADRRAAHAALAAVETDPARQAWHLSGAATGPDADTAAALEAAGDEALGRGAHAAAARAFEQAASLSPTDEDRARRMAGASEQWLVAGSLERSRELASRARELALEATVRSEAELTLSRLEVMGGSLDSAQALALSAAEGLAQSNPERALAMLFEAQTTHTLSGRLEDSRAISERAFALAEGGPLEDVAAVMLGTELTLAGEFERGANLMSRWRSLGVEELVAAGPPTFFALTLCLMWVGEYHSALENCDSTVVASRARGAAAPLQMALGQRAELHRRLGDWTQARADAAESARLAGETGQVVQGLYPYAIQLRLEAALGLDAALERLPEVLAIAHAAQVGSVLAYLSAGEMLAALGSGDVTRAVVRGRETRDRLDEQGMQDPSVIQWRPDFVEALVRASERDEALAETEAFGLQAERTGLPWPNAAAARCRGLTAQNGDFDTHFAEALEWHARGEDPYERARTELAYGERLRRAQRPSEARAQLRSALEVFEGLGAEPWARRARGELRASGGALPSARQPVSRELTAQELEVALLVSGGATNREAAATLFLSPKTIEAHLGRAYRKLGVRSRTELAALMSEQRAPAA